MSSTRSVPAPAVLLLAFVILLLAVVLLLLAVLPEASRRSGRAPAHPASPTGPASSKHSANPNRCSQPTTPGVPGHDVTPGTRLPGSSTAKPNRPALNSPQAPRCP